MKKLTCLSLSIGMLAPLVASNLAAEQAGKDIIKQEFHREVGEDSIAQMTMTLKNKRGRTRVRTLTLSSIQVGDLRRQLIRFSEPKNIAGTTFLSRELNITDDDEQFLYLPAAGRARRIVSGQKAKAFVNSNYTYEDMQRRHYSKDQFQITGKDNHLGRTCTKVRREPINADSSQYGALEACIDPTISLALAAEYFDKSGKKTKVFTVKSLKQIAGIWTIMHSELKDLEDGSSTELAVQSITYNTGLQENDFSSSKLRSRK